ncbi:Sentrin-specific protease 1, partial [Orchesella cincta]
TLVTRTKDYITALVSPHQETDRNCNNSNSLGEGRGRFASIQKYFHNRGGPSQKRPAASAFEPEITDDEDEELPGAGNSYNFPVPKRPRVDFNGEMSSKRSHLFSPPPSSNSRYVTRGSGKTPELAGLKKQPWDFDFTFGRSRRKIVTQINMREPACESKDSRSVVDIPGPSQGSVVVNNSKNYSYRNSTGSKVVNIPIRMEEDFSFSRTGGLRQVPEVITLDDCDDPPPCSALVPLPPSKNEMERIIRPKISSPIQKASSKARDQNNICRYLSTSIGQKLPGKSSSRSSSNAIRPHEKDQYRKLLQEWGILNVTKRPLFKSKIGQPDLQVMYNRRFQSSPTNGTVTIMSRAKALLEQTDASSSISQRISLPHLFSTPKEPVNFSGRSRASSSVLPPKDAPLVIDLEPDFNCKELVTFQPPVSPISKPEKSSHSTSLNISAVGNFSNLEDALNISALVKSSEDEEEGSFLESSQHDAQDEDLSVIAEKVVNKSRNSTMNTLALEQTSCPYVDKRWLVDSQSSWRENQRHRNNRIREQSGTIDLLRRESTLEKELEDRIRKKLTLTEIIVLEEPPAGLPELDDEMRDIIQRAKARGNDNDVLAQVRLLKDTISITRGDIRTLGPSQWLNDNVINTYMGLIVLRSKTTDNLPKVYAFQTFFYPKLLKEGYSNSLKRWTRKDDIFAHDLIVLPIHLGLHWCLACVDFKSKSILYFDSLGGDNNKCLHSLMDYISKEMRERKQMELNKDEWTLTNVKGIPQQQNGSDCGMFACKFAEYLSREAKFTFTQENMPYYRDRMIYELLKQDLMSP